MPTRNPAWQRDELILALDLYFRVNPTHTTERHPAIQALSQVLKELPIHEVRPDPEKFRNPSGVYMKLCNFLRLDPEYQGVGLDAGSQLDETVWAEFAHDRERLATLAIAIKNGITTVPPVPAGPPEEEDEAPEGKILHRLHRTRERDPRLVAKKKKQALERDGVLRCEVCDFVYNDLYGTVGEGFMECHHNKPVSTLQPGETTKLSDLSLVCANCHRMLHRGGELLTVTALRAIVLTRRGVARGA